LHSRRHTISYLLQITPEGKRWTSRGVGNVSENEPLSKGLRYFANKKLKLKEQKNMPFKRTFRPGFFFFGFIFFKVSGGIFFVILENQVILQRN
jgi:hypothetical protein